MEETRCVLSTCLSTLESSRGGYLRIRGKGVVVGLSREHPGHGENISRLTKSRTSFLFQTRMGNAKCLKRVQSHKLLFEWLEPWAESYSLLGPQIDHQCSGHIHVGQL